LRRTQDFFFSSIKQTIFVLSLKNKNFSKMGLSNGKPNNLARVYDEDERFESN